MNLEKKFGLFCRRWLNFKYGAVVLGIAVAFFSLLAFSRYFGIQLMEFDAVDKILFHGKAEMAEVFRIFSQPDGHLIYSVSYRPLSSLAWWIIFLFNGLDFTAFHAFNFALHALNSVLVFALARKLIKDKSGFFSFLAALVFAVHPIHLNSVLFVSRMPELLAAFFMLCSLLSLNAFIEKKCKRFYFLSFFFCFAGIFSKESGALIPIILFFYCLVFLRERTLKRLLFKSTKFCAPFFSLIALYAALMFFSLGKAGGYYRLQIPFRSQMLFNLFQPLFYPINFLAGNISGEFNQILQLPLADALLLIAFAAFAFGALWVFSRKEQDKPVSFLFCWLLIFAVAFSLLGVMRMWYTYAPLIPFVLLLSIFLSRCCGKFSAGNLSKPVSLLIALLFLSFIAFSSLAVNYRQPLIAGEITQNVLSQTTDIAAGVPPESTLLLLNYPSSITFSENGLSYSVILVNERLVQSLLDYRLPEKKQKVVSLSESILFTPLLDENQLTFGKKVDCNFLIENSNAKKARIKLPLRWGKGKEKQTGIILDFNRSAAAETIEITLPENYCESAFFLFFDGRQVRLIKASAFK